MENQDKTGVLRRTAEGAAAAVRRFPVVYAAGLVGAAAMFAGIVGDEKAFAPVCLAAVWTEVAAFLLPLAAEFGSAGGGNRGRRLKAAANIAAAAAFLLLYAWCRSWESLDEDPYFPLNYGATLLALVMLCGLLLTLRQGGKTAANLFVAAGVAGIVQTCVEVSLHAILAAVNFLLVDIDSEVFMAALAAPTLLVFTGVFVPIAARDADGIKIPKVVKLAFHHTLLPLYAVFLAILYAYLAKSAILAEMPSGVINPFVSAATLAHLVLRMTLAEYDTKPARLFRRFGALLLVPLVAAQCAAWGIRVSGYGLTTARYASLLYIVFSGLCTAGAIWDSFAPRKIDIDRWAWAILAAIALFACLPRVNLIDLPEFLQAARVERILDAHSLIGGDGKIDAARAERELSDEEKAQIRSACDEIRLNKGEFAWFSDENADFQKAAESRRRAEEDDDRYRTPVDAKEWTEIGTAGFSAIRQIVRSSWDGTTLTVEDGAGNSFDITADIFDNGRARPAESPLSIDREGFRIIITWASTHDWTDGGEARHHGSASGFILQR